MKVRRIFRVHPTVRGFSLGQTTFSQVMYIFEIFLLFNTNYILDGGQWSQTKFKWPMIETLVQTIFFFCSMLEPSSAGACLIFEILQGRNFSQNSLPLWSIILPIVPKCSPNSRILCVSSGFSFAVKENLSPKRHKKMSKSPISSYT